MTTCGWMTRSELAKTFGAVGTDVLVDRDIRLVNPQHITLGSHVRIDVDAFLVAGTAITIGSWVHLGAAVHLMAAGGAIKIDDFCGLSSRVSVFTTTDDYSTGFLTNPTVPTEFRKVRTGPVRFEKHALVGCGTVILPDVTLGFGCAVGALTLVNRSVPRLAVVAGQPLRRLGLRDGERLKQLEAEVRRQYGA
jgi:galactoside O-acetyltransferase